ncbi:MAG: hypothetical protein QOE33_907 [Acidobacteriota bacterium]|nr:hypothetical protein [Acidobacteriota bacterium]
MSDKQRRHFERLTRVESYGEAHAADFPETSKGGQALARLRELIAHDTLRATTQRARQQATGSRSDGRKDLRAQLVAIAKTAETIGLDHRK